METLKKELAEIQARNKKVEADKAWEISMSRKLVLSLITYIVIAALMVAINLPNPFSNALIPAIAFLISTFSLKFFKIFWLKFIYKK